MSSLESITSAIWTHKELILGAVATIIAGRKLIELSKEKHTQEKSDGATTSSASAASSASSSSSSSSVDLFPQFFPSFSCPSLSLYHRRWEVTSPRFFVFLFHGYGEHIGRYECLAARINAVGGSVYGLDHQGHGQSQGDRAHVERFTHYTQDALAFVEFIQKNRLKEYEAKDRRLPTFLFGHSMGGLVASQMMLASYTSSSQPDPLILRDQQWNKRIWPWTGCVLSSPALAPNPKDANPALIAVAGFLSRTLPKMQLTGLPLYNISRFPAVVTQYDNDILNWHGTMRARWASEMLEGMQVVKENMEQVEWPYLLITGGSDIIVYVKGTLKFHEGTKSKDKTLRVWPDGCHELMNDLVADEAFQCITEWLQKRAE